MRVRLWLLCDYLLALPSTLYPILYPLDIYLTPLSLLTTLSRLPQRRFFGIWSSLWDEASA
jgi:hypothetical protein